MSDTEFKLTHGSATAEKALAAAARVEALVGRVAKGERRALDKLQIEDLALMVQFVRNATAVAAIAKTTGSTP